VRERGGDREAAPLSGVLWRTKVRGAAHREAAEWASLVGGLPGSSTARQRSEPQATEIEGGPWRRISFPIHFTGDPTSGGAVEVGATLGLESEGEA
jgi:hypothetical protein